MEKQARKIEIKCPCGARFEAFQCRLGRKKYCNKSCFYLYRTHPSGLKYNIKSDNPSWYKFRGGWVTDKGYLVTTQRGRQIGIHRLVVEESIGRSLTSAEVVHHKNGNKLDNRIENLEVLSKAVHDAIHHGIGARALV